MATPTPSPETYDFFIANSGLWSFLATVSTLIMVIITYISLRENVLARRSQLQPNIIIDFVIEYFYILQIVIKNTGNNPALNVKITIEPNINHPFNNIKFLAPNSEMRHPVDYLKEDSKIIEEYKILISYSDVYKKLHKNSYTINIKPLLQSYLNHKPNDLADIAKGLDGLVKVLESPYFRK